MTTMQAGQLLVELAAAYPQMKLPPESVKVWRSWLEAMPYEDTRRGLLVVCAREEWPKITNVIAAAGIASEQAVAMLVAAREGGFAILRDDTTQHGWRTTRDALPQPNDVHGPSVPMPVDVREKMRGFITKFAAERSIS